MTSAPPSEPVPNRDNLAPYRAVVHRIVEAQHRISTNRLAATASDQEVLERLVEEVKPAMPKSAAGLHFLLGTPFRYGYARPSRFRRAGERPGIFYAAETARTAIAETAYWRLRFFAGAPGALLPASVAEHSGFSVPVRVSRAIDLTKKPFGAFAHLWTADDYEACQRLAARSRAIGAQLIRYRSARDPDRGANVALLDPAGFAETSPKIDQTWHFKFESRRLIVMAAFPASETFSFTFEQFGLKAPQA
jgi:hypothetical protein